MLIAALIDRESLHLQSLFWRQETGLMSLSPRETVWVDSPDRISTSTELKSLIDIPTAVILFSLKNNSKV